MVWLRVIFSTFIFCVLLTILFGLFELYCALLVDFCVSVCECLYVRDVCQCHCLSDMGHVARYKFI